METKSYVSHCVTRGWYGVVDPKTGMTTIMSENALFNKVHNGDEILGVSLVTQLGSERVLIKPYQPLETLSKLQVKTKLLKQVDVRVHGSEIIYVEWPASIQEPVHIKLSDFGSSLGKYSISFATCIGSPAKCIFEFDDSVCFGDMPLLVDGDITSNRCARFDLTKVTNKHLKMAVYDCLAAQINTWDVEHLIIDTEKPTSQSLLEREFC